MQYTEVMVRYGELSTKGKNRKDFIGRLAGNVTRALQDFPEIEIHPKHDRMHIVLNGAPFETIDQRLKLVFGIQTYSPTIKVDKNLDAIKKASLELMQATFKDGMTAPEMAGIIHTDFQRGFIRAETYSYDDLMVYKTELATREAGKVRQEGKAYVGQDGDIMFFKFNV